MYMSFMYLTFVGRPQEAPPGLNRVKPQYFSESQPFYFRYKK